MVERMNELLQQICGKKCWGISAGAPNGSYVTLHFGEKIARDHPISNKNLLYGLGEFAGEYRLGIFSTWRLQTNGKPITGSSEPNGHGGPLDEGLLRLLNSTITNIRMTNSCGDLNIGFGRIYLKVFCSNTGNGDDDYYAQHESNWVLSRMGKPWIEVERGCNLKVNS